MERPGGIGAHHPPHLQAFCLIGCERKGGIKRRIKDGAEVFNEGNGHGALFSCTCGVACRAMTPPFTTASWHGSGSSSAALARQILGPLLIRYYYSGLFDNQLAAGVHGQRAEDVQHVAVRLDRGSLPPW